MIKYSFYRTVREFMITAGQPIDGDDLSPENIQLRNDLFHEELSELREAIVVGDRILQLDAIIDLLYIIGGTAVTYVYENFDNRIDDALRLAMPNNDTQAELINISFAAGAYQYSVNTLNSIMVVAKNLGFTSPQIFEGFKRVHESNMTKFCRTKREAKNTLFDYIEKGIECTWVERNGLYVVVRNDGKILKSSYYKPVDLSDVI